MVDECDTFAHSEDKSYFFQLNLNLDHVHNCDDSLKQPPQVCCICLEDHIFYKTWLVKIW